ncbi:MAG: hypothetical protein Q4D45_11890 [Lachnospiraceae bacterium]|nr:hypothetical protein [Lachnospiraceae bacterium]
MSKKTVIFVGIFVLILPFWGLLIAWGFFGKFIFNNPDFWYGYMSYFGTVSLAIVALLQNINANEINNRFIIQQLKQKIGYLNLKQIENEHSKVNKYQELQVGQFYNATGKIEQTKDKILAIWLNNVGEDIILNLNILSGKINEESVHIPCSINIVYKNENICIELDNTQYFQTNELKIELLIQMQNVAGITYKQNFYIEAQKNGATVQGTYFVTKFSTDIDFEE